MSKNSDLLNQINDLVQNIKEKETMLETCTNKNLARRLRGSITGLKEAKLTLIKKYKKPNLRG